jgi:hypothetical protein
VGADAAADVSAGPIIDATEFSSRFLAFSNGSANALSPAGQLIASILVIWGASFGVNEYGREEENAAAEPQSPSAIPSDDAVRKRRDRKDLTNRMLGQVLKTIDAYGILRKPSWDGVRALLLTLPLTAEVQPPMERLVSVRATSIALSLTFFSPCMKPHYLKYIPYVA